MNSPQKSPRAALAKAIRANDLGAIKKICEASPNLRQQAAVAGPWINVAVKHGSIETLSLLIDLGFDPNMPDETSGQNALATAASRGEAEKTALLLSIGTKVDVGASTSNPLFSAVYGRSFKVVECLLEAGIDATTDYEISEGVRYDAVCFALEQGERKIASRIALHVASGDKTSAQDHLDRAWDAVKRANPGANPANVPTSPALQDI